MKDHIKAFKKDGYCLVKSAISTELRDFVTQYALFDEMQTLEFGDPQVPSAHSKYADPAMETMLLHLQKTIEDATGLSLFPTYSYYRVYRPGDELSPHKDRPSCEISATMCFNYSYDANKFTWPIYMDGVKIILDPGDLAVYRGCDLMHWRDEFVEPEENSWHVQGFFHFVDVNGPHSNCKYDGRSTIGEKLNKHPKSYVTLL